MVGHVYYMIRWRNQSFNLSHRRDLLYYCGLQSGIYSYIPIYIYIRYRRYIQICPNTITRMLIYAGPCYTSIPLTTHSSFWLFLLFLLDRRYMFLTFTTTACGPPRVINLRCLKSLQNTYFTYKYPFVFRRDNLDDTQIKY